VACERNPVAPAEVLARFRWEVVEVWGRLVGCERIGKW